MEFKNYTPHPVNIFDSKNKKIMVIPVETDNNGQKIQVRVSEITEPREPIEGIPIIKKLYGDVVGLPAPQAGVILIVSIVVLAALQGKRADVVCPDTGVDSVVRDGQGNILGVRRFQV